MNVVRAECWALTRGPLTNSTVTALPKLRESWRSYLRVDEVDPYKKPKELLEVSPKGLVPGLRLNQFTPPKALNESTVIMEYAEE